MQNSKEFEIQLLKKFPELRNIKIRGVPIWQACRVSFINAANPPDFQATNRKTENKKLSRGKLFFTFLFNSFYRISMFFRLLKKQNYILFTDILEDRVINNVYNDKIAIPLIQYHSDDLLVIKQMLNQRCSFKKKYVYKNWMPDSPWVLCIFFLSKLLPLFSRFSLFSYEYKKLQEINEYYEISFDWRKTMLNFFATYLVFHFLFNIYKPKQIYVNCSYCYFHQPIIYAAKKNNINTIELQHGIILNHEAYNIPMDVGKETYPNEIWVFGDYVKKEISANFCYYDGITSIGNFFLKYIYQSTLANEDIQTLYNEYRKKFSLVVSVSEQIGFNNVIYAFIKEVANKNPDVLFVLMPRKPRNIADEFKNFKNITENRFTTHENMIYSNIHTTMHSTTAFESWYFGIPVIFMNIENISKTYFGELLENDRKEFFQFADAPQDFCKFLRSTPFAKTSEIQNYGKEFYAEPNLPFE